MSAQPLFAAPGGDETERFQQREEAIRAQGAQGPAEQWGWYVWQTITVAKHDDLKRIIVATDYECNADEWLAASDLLKKTGWGTDNPEYDDIGEPGFDLVSRVWVWALDCP